MDNTDLHFPMTVIITSQSQVTDRLIYVPSSTMLATAPTALTHLRSTPGVHPIVFLFLLPSTPLHEVKPQPLDLSRRLSIN